MKVKWLKSKCWCRAQCAEPCGYCMDVYRQNYGTRDRVVFGTIVLIITIIIYLI